jgi:hypothetical protein
MKVYVALETEINGRVLCSCTHTMRIIYVIKVILQFDFS